MSGAPVVLFDAPGPKARARHRIATVIAGVILLGLIALVLRGLADPENNQLTAEKWTPFFTAEAWLYYYLPGIGATLLAAAVSVVDADSLAVTATIPVGRYPEGVAIRDGFAYVANWFSDDVSVIDLATLRETRRLPVAEGPRTVTVASQPPAQGALR